MKKWVLGGMTTALLLVAMTFSLFSTSEDVAGDFPPTPTGTYVALDFPPTPTGGTFI